MPPSGQLKEYTSFSGACRLHVLAPLLLLPFSQVTVYRPAMEAYSASMKDTLGWDVTRGKMTAREKPCWVASAALKVESVERTWPMPAISSYSQPPTEANMWWLRLFMEGPSYGPSGSSHRVVAGSSGWLNLQGKEARKGDGKRIRRGVSEVVERGAAGRAA